MAKKGVEEGATHVTPEKDSKRADKPRYALLLTLNVGHVGLHMPD